MLRLTACLVVTLLTCSPSFAQFPRDAPIWAEWSSVPSRKSPFVKDNNLYAIEVTCRPYYPLIDPSTYSVARTRSLQLLIGNSIPRDQTKLPSDAVAAMEIYSIGKDKDSNQSIIRDDRECHKSFLVHGSRSLTLIPTDNRIDDYSNSVFGQIFVGASKLISPLFGLFYGRTISDTLSGKISNAQDSQNAIQTILNALGRGVNRTWALRPPLRVGKYVYSTSYVRVTVTIRPIASIVLDANSDFRKDLRDQVNSASVKLDAAKLEQTCRGGVFDISQLGLKSPTDIGYGLLYLGAHAGFDRTQNINCLTRKYAVPVAKAGDRLWEMFPSEFRFDLADIDKVFEPKQPGAETTASNMDRLVVALAQYSRNDPPPPRAVDVITRSLSPQITIIDDTSSSALGLDAQPVERFAAIKKLRDKGYMRFGCYAPTSDATDQNVDGAAWMFLVSRLQTTTPNPHWIQHLLSDRSLRRVRASFPRSGFRTIERG